jgi:hypothetical protein
LLQRSQDRVMYRQRPEHQHHRTTTTAIPATILTFQWKIHIPHLPEYQQLLQPSLINWNPTMICTTMALSLAMAELMLLKRVSAEQQPS